MQEENKEAFRIVALQAERTREALDAERAAHAKTKMEMSVEKQAAVKEAWALGGAGGAGVGVIVGLVLASLFRRRAAVGVLLGALMAISGCSTCSDGQKTNPLGGGLLTNSSSYSACNRGCVTKGKRCDCSKQCPCWDEHVKKK